MAHNHAVVIDTADPAPRSRAGGEQFNTDRPTLNFQFVEQLGAGARKATARADILPNTGVGSGMTSPMLSARPRGGIAPNRSQDPRDLVTEIGGVELTLAMAQQLGLVGQGPGGEMVPSERFVASKMEEGRQAAEVSDAESMPIANAETSEWLEQVDQACTAAGMSAGLDDLTHAVLRAGSAEEVVNLFSKVSDAPEEAAADFASIVSTWTEGLADALGMDVEEVDDLLDAAIEQHGLGAVVGRALAGAHRRSYAPILAMLKHRLA